MLVMISNPINNSEYLITIMNDSQAKKTFEGIEPDSIVRQGNHHHHTSRF